MLARNLPVLSSSICVLGPREADFANSARVHGNLLLNSLGHLYIYIVVTSNFPNIVIGQSTEKRLRREKTGSVTSVDVRGGPRARIPRQDEDC